MNTATRVFVGIAIVLLAVVLGVALHPLWLLVLVVLVLLLL